MDDFDPYELEVLRSKTSKNNNLGFDDNQLICECSCVSYAQIKDYLKGDEVNFEHLRLEFGLGAGCKSCINLISNFLKQKHLKK